MEKTMRFMSPEEFEQWQLEGKMVFCRYCGLTYERPVPMEVRPAMALQIEGQYRNMAVYICPSCGHAALSELLMVPEEPADEEDSLEHRDYHVPRIGG